MATPAAIAARSKHRHRGPLPKTEIPRTIERAYLRELIRLVRQARELVNEQLLPHIDELVAEASADSLTTDAWDDLIKRIMDDIRRNWVTRVTPEDFVRVAYRAGWRTVDINKLRNLRQLKVLTGLDLAATIPGLDALMRSWIEENVALIKSVPERYFSEIETLTHRNIRSGTRAGALADEIRERYKVSESRAALIARDQTGKLNGVLTKRRQEDAGISEYIWRTAKDDLVRPGHARLEGKRFSWSKPPVVDTRTGRRAHPGQDFQCRCTPEPLLPGID